MTDSGLPVVATNDFKHLSGNDARSHNITAARSIAETIRSTLGPSGLDKMLISSQGTVSVTNDGETILNEMDIDHPGAQVIIEVARTQAKQAGDGTTTAVLLAIELLRAAKDLFEQGIHPTVIVDGYERAVAQVLNDISAIANTNDTNDEILHDVAKTALTGKAVSGNVETLAALSVDATRAVTVEDIADLELLKLISIPGMAASNSELRQGAVLNTGPCLESMPKECQNANVLLLHQDFEVSDTELEIKARVDSPKIRKKIAERSDRWINNAMESLTDLDVSVVLCHKRIDDSVKQQLSSYGILAIDHIKRTETEFEFLQEVTSATPITDPTATTPAHLGQINVSQDGPFYIENPDTPGVTLVVRGTNENIASEIERSVKDAINGVARVIGEGRFLPAGGASEIELATSLRDHARGIKGRKQLAVDAFADALEIVPRTIAKNAGYDPIDILVDLRSIHADGQTHVGLNINTGKYENMADQGIIQPAYLIEQYVYNASKAVAILLKIDEIISAADINKNDK